MGAQCMCMGLVSGQNSPATGEAAGASGIYTVTGPGMASAWTAVPWTSPGQLPTDVLAGACESVGIGTDGARRGQAKAPAAAARTRYLLPAAQESSSGPGSSREATSTASEAVPTTRRTRTQVRRIRRVCRLRGVLGHACRDPHAQAASAAQARSGGLERRST